MVRLLCGVLICSAFMMVVSGCSKSVPAPIPTYSSIAFFHGSPSISALNVFLDGTQLNSSAFEYSSFSGALSANSGNRNIKFTSFTSNLTLIDTTVSLVNLKSYSIFVINNKAIIKPLMTQDEGELASPTTNLMIRFIHLSPDAPSAYVVLLGETAALVPAQTYQKASAFLEIPTKTYTFEVRATSDNHVIATTASLNAQAGIFYTVALYGYSTPPSGNSNKIAAKVLAY